jgi:hypothetical protein
MVLYYDLKVLASVNGIDWATNHAMRIGAGPARGSNHKIVQASSSTEKARDGDAMCLSPVLLDATSGTGIATSTVVQVEDKNTLTLVESLSNVVVEDSVTDGRAPQTSERLFNHPPAKNTEFA